MEEQKGWKKHSILLLIGSDLFYLICITFSIAIAFEQANQLFYVYNAMMIVCLSWTNTIISRMKNHKLLDIIFCISGYWFIVLTLVYLTYFSL